MFTEYRTKISPKQHMTDVIIIGAGLSGLAAAINLHEKGYSVKVLEAANHIGGRVWTDEEDGYLFDRGFQVLLTEYPECKKVLDYEALDLRSFKPGAKVLDEKGSLTLSDPYRDPGRILSMFFSRVGSFSDKIHIDSLRRQLKKTTVAEIFEREEVDTASALKEYGFSEQINHLFFEPFMKGIFLEDQLSSSRRMFDFTYKMFSSGHAAIPARGMKEIPLQLAARLPQGTIGLNRKVTRVRGRTVYTNDAEQIEAKAILIATDATALQPGELLRVSHNRRSVTNLYFAAPKMSDSDALLVLNATQGSLVNNLVVMDSISTHYAPADKSLISVSINGMQQENDETLASRVKEEMSIWYGEAAKNWQLLRVYRIPYALPDQDSVRNTLNPEDIKLAKGIYLAGDHLLNGSINAAMKSGRLAAECIDADLHHG